MARLSFEAFPRALDSNGNPAGGAKLYVYEAGTTTAVTTYSDLAETTAHTSPVIADSAGFFPEIYTSDDSLKIRVTDAADVLIFEADNVPQQITITGDVWAESFGAKGDGSTDNKAAVTAAVAHLTALGGGKLKFGPGDFVFDSQVLLSETDDNILFQGSGPDTVFIKGVDNNINVLRVLGDYFKIRDITFDGDKASNTTDTTLLFIYGDDCTVENCIFRNSTRNGLAFADDTPGSPKRATVVHCTFEDNDGVGLSTAGLDRFVIANNTFRSNGWEGLTLDQNTRNGSVTCNLFEDNNLGGVDTDTSTTVYGIGQLGYDNGDGLSITSNVFIEKTTGTDRVPAIRMGNALGDTLGMTIVGNIIVNHLVGIDFRGTAATTATDQNTIVQGNAFRLTTTAIAYDSDAIRLEIGTNSYTGVTTPIDDSNAPVAARLPARLSSWSMNSNNAQSSITGNGALVQVAYDTDVPTGCQQPPTVNTGTGAVTITVSAFYEITASVAVSSIATAASGHIEVRQNGTAIGKRRWQFNGTTGDDTMTITTSQPLTSGDVITVHAVVNGMAGNTAGFAARPIESEFTGHLVH
ncbi:right-handed parallel beta-helix repeat-containing protein [Leisingera sp. ANG-M7]|uniref:right-handed parallel beta-helix repeat-containing protein n=1 Tax=Leisingera sp. ANG-M7 TaxID=1577902 RepID=UPI00057C6778|nr:right-handed parallel beta-helix repeat-containing protein [Leisingera sp. ANG-M7]KIC39354.1 hypothetical protein RA26_01490 [Leisingera sp. ANG-M7]